MLMIMDVVLCIVQEVENKKALDEAFICLTLARLVSDAPPNIVEFFGASILPHYSGSNRLQLFLELMPGQLPASFPHLATHRREKQPQREFPLASSK